MPEATENLVIKEFLESHIITQDEYDILFCLKDDWFTINNAGNQDWSISEDKQIEFWTSINKIKNFVESLSANHHIPGIYDFSFIKFPIIKIADCSILTPNKLLPKFTNKCLFIIFYKAIFYGEVVIGKSKFDIDLDFRKCIFNDTFSIIDCEFKSVEFSDATFHKEVEIRKSTFNNGTKFNNATFNDNIKLKELHFKGNVNLGIISHKKSDFNDLTFEQIASFDGARFLGSISLGHSNFNNFTDFTNTVFNEQVFFSHIFFNDVFFLGRDEVIYYNKFKN